MKLTKCPYCGKQMTYFQAFFNRTRGEFFCNKCKKESNILIKKALLIPFFVALFLSILILLAFFFMTDKTSLWFMLFVIIPFIGFYAFTPFFVVLKPRKKHMDVLYDTGIIESPIVDPDPTMAQTSNVVPTFVDDVVLTDDDKPVINADVFNAIKEDRKIVDDAKTGGDTRSFSKFENISSNKDLGDTMPVTNLKNISSDNNDVKVRSKRSYDLSQF